MVIVGVPAAPVTVPLPEIQDLQIRIQGSATYTRDDYAEATAMITEGLVRPEDFVTAQYPLTEVAAAFADTSSGRKREGGGPGRPLIPPPPAADGQTLITVGPMAAYRWASFAEMDVSVISDSKSPISANRQKLETPNLVWMPMKIRPRAPTTNRLFHRGHGRSGVVSPCSREMPLAPRSARSMTSSFSIRAAEVVDGAHRPATHPAAEDDHRQGMARRRAPRRRPATT